jgi:hypothetical protein
MTSSAVTASMCASASEVALLVASFMPVLSLNLGATVRGARYAQRRQNFHSEHPATFEYSPDCSPHSANIDCASVEQYCGGNLTQECRRTDSVLAKSSPLTNLDEQKINNRNRQEPRENHGPHRL